MQPKAASPNRDFRYADDRNIRYCRMLDQNQLDFLGGNVFPTRHDDILQPIFDEQVTMLVDPADIAGSNQPSAKTSAVSSGIFQ